MSYQIEFHPKAEKFLESLSVKFRRQVSSKINGLAENPRPPGCKKLKGPEVFYRISSSDYRIIYQIKDDKLLVLVLRIGDRKEIYRFLKKLS